MKIALLSATAAALVFASAPAFAAPTVTDGSFENTGVNNSPNYGTPANEFSGGAGAEPNGGAFGYAAAPDGTFVAHIQPGGIVTLDVGGLIPGGAYAVNFLAAARANYGNLPVTVAFDGVNLGTFTPTSTSFSSFSYNFAFPNIDSNSGTLTFTGLVDGTGADLNTAIDQVTVTAVPEPATWAMMLLGFGMIGFGLRARRRSTKVSFA